jgi:alpha-ketoglutarate-dependent taurine dioxygenase
MTAHFATAAQAIRITPLQPCIGAELSGIDLRQTSAQDIAAIRAALLKHKVIFFRDQDISGERHVAFGRAFGDLEIHPLAAHPDYPELLPITSNGRESPTANFWHTDTTFRAEPSAASILRALTLPPLGGDTLWVNMVAVYEGLDAAMRDRLDGLYAVHDAIISFGGYLNTAARRRDFYKQFPLQTHPVVRIHPETGEKALYVNSGFTDHVVGLNKRESKALLGYLFDQVKKPEYQVRFRWRPNSIAFWDNRATQHYAVADYDAPRHLERVTIIGDKPIGPAQKRPADPAGADVEMGR